MYFLGGSLLRGPPTLRAVARSPANPAELKGGQNDRPPAPQGEQHTSSCHSSTNHP